LFVAVPIWLITWHVRYRALETSDPDYKTAKRDWLIAVIIWLPALGLQVISLATGKLTN
jgi:hypothetical protein